MAHGVARLHELAHLGDEAHDPVIEPAALLAQDFVQADERRRRTAVPQSVQFAVEGRAGDTQGDALIEDRVDHVARGQVDLEEGIARTAEWFRTA